MSTRAIRAVAGGIFLIALVVAGCSSPLEPSLPPEVTSILENDTIYVVDTVLFCDSSSQGPDTCIGDTVFMDTLVYTDTVFLPDTCTGDTVWVDTLWLPDTGACPDTLVLTDTVVIVDTVQVPAPDTGWCPPLCSQMSSHQQKINWLLGNEAGDYRVELEAYTEWGKPPKTLRVEIGSKTYTWEIQADPNFTVELTLKENTRISISSCSPKSYGHDATVCARIVPL